jgi:transposase
MEIKEEIYQQIEAVLPRRRGKEVISNRRFLEALVYRLENGCKWRKLPKAYGDWHVIYVRANRWAAKGIMEGIYRRLQSATLATVPIDVVSLDSTIVKVHPDACGGLKKTAFRR